MILAFGRYDFRQFYTKSLLIIAEVAFTKVTKLFVQYAMILAFGRYDFDQFMLK